jgi:hypothetical protein
MLSLSAAIVVSVLVVTDAQALTAPKSPTCEPAATIRRELWRGLPETFYDQGRASIAAMYPQHRLLAERRVGRLANIDYSLLAFQPTREEPVQLVAVAVDWKTNRAWDVKATCAPDRWANGLIAMLEAIALAR